MVAAPHPRPVRTRRRPAVMLAVAVALLVLAAACGSPSHNDSVSPGNGADETTRRKVTVAGDSISVGLGAALRNHVPDDVEVVVIGEEGTGIARADTFDWPERLERLAREFPPDVLVFSVGSNDAQPLLDPDGDTVAAFDPTSDRDDEAWDEAYAERLARAFDAFEQTGTTVVWVGHLRTVESDVADTNRRVHRIAEEVAAERPWVRTADLVTLLGFAETETAGRCLAPDGLHVDVDCLDEAAAALQGVLTLS